VKTRLDELDSGRVQGVPAAQVFARARRVLANAPQSLPKDRALKRRRAVTWIQLCISLADDQPPTKSCFRKIESRPR
jgi:hypothetical protein